MSPKLILSVTTIPVISMFSSCSNFPREPEAKSKNAVQSLNVPAKFESETLEVPEIAKGLMSLFSDKRLNSYVNEALVNSPDLQLSLANLEEAGFNTRSSYAPGLPSLTGNGTAGRIRNNGSSTGLYSASLDAQWEVDVWGRIRAGVIASKRDQAAIAADHESARQSVLAQTMQAYFSLVASEKLLSLSQRRLSSFEQTVNLVQRRFESGTGNLSDLDLARTDVETTKAEEEGRKDDRDQAARRADAGVTVAHRDLYPSFPLTASVGQESNVLSDLANSNFNVWSILANFSAPIIDGGERRSELGAANARAKQALALYRSTVLDAFEEVENALGSEYYLERQQKSFINALSAARSAETRTRRNYENGLVEILTLLDAQRRSFSTEESLINTEALRFQNRVSLALALGKGL